MVRRSATGGRPAGPFALREAIREGRIEDVISEAEARGVEPADRAALERVLKALFRPPQTRADEPDAGFDRLPAHA